MDNVIIALCADTHCGSSLGLMQPGGFNLHDGGTYQASYLQRKIWDVWDESWQKIAKARKGRKLIVVHDGDATEGLHHGTTQLVSSRVDEHEQIHIDAMDHALKTAKFDANKGDKLYYVAGTEEHAGKGSEYEETIANDMDAIGPSKNRHTWDVIKKSVNGVTVDISHHGGKVGRNVLTRENGLFQTIKNIYFECIDQKLPVPRYWIRAHYHQFVHAIYYGREATIEGIMLPSLQYKTGFVYKTKGDTYLLPDVGMIWLFIDADGTTQWEHNMIHHTPDEVGTW